MIKNIFYAVLLITILTLLVGFFASDSATAVCSDSLINCIEKANDGTFFDKLQAGFICVYKNILCVANQFLNLFR